MARFRTPDEFAISMLRRLSFILLLGVPFTGRAQAVAHENATTADSNWTRRFSVWIGGAQHSSTRVWIGATPDRDLLLAALRSSWVAPSQGRFAAEIAAEVLPLVRYWNTAGPRRPERRGKVMVIRPSDTERALGFGLIPLDLGVRIRPHARTAITTGAFLGAIWFNKRVPDVMAARFNYTLGARVGAEVALGHGRFTTFAYRLQHVSNAGQAKSNPGIDNHVFSVGMGRAW